MKAFLLAAAVAAGADALDNGLGRTPPMGFNTWNHFGCIKLAPGGSSGPKGPTETLMKAQAATMISTGMAAAGYTHVNIDDCWQLTNRTLPWEDPKAKQIANPYHFPSGMKALADHLHSLNPPMKLGVYTARCRFTCQLFAASFGHEAVDAQQWSEWGVDYLKMDECYGAVEPPTWTGWDDAGVKPTRADGSCHDLDPDPLHRLGVMRDALNASGRPIFFSNEYPAAHENYPPYGQKGVYNLTWMVEHHGKAMGAHANMWRISQDIRPSWHSILNNIDFDEMWAEFSAPGAINDPDMLQVGNGALTQTEDLSHMSMWCMLAAPLLAGNDLTKMTPYVKSVLIHEGLIAIDQDPLVSQAVVAKEGGRNTSKLDQGWQIWKRPLHDGTKAALLLNRGATNLSITLEFSDVGISGSPAKIHDVWAREDLSLPSGAASFTAVVPAHGSLTLKLTPAAVATATGGGAVRVCDSVRSIGQGGPRFTRSYVQLDCALDQSIASIDRVVAGDDLDGWRCGQGDHVVRPTGTAAGLNQGAQGGGWMVEEARAACLGMRSCRVRLGQRPALALEGTCK